MITKTYKMFKIYLKQKHIVNVNVKLQENNNRFEKETLPLRHVEMLWTVIMTFSLLKTGD